MFRLEVLQNQWVILALLGGTALVLLTALGYVAVWRTAREKTRAEAAGEPEAPAPPRRVPWVIIALWVATAVYAIFYVILAVLNPPTW